MISDIANRLRKTLGVLGSVQYDERFGAGDAAEVISAEPLKVVGGN
tara:strand:+ start:326 stop:463 length:138 start_codon:yes stop_codon:yes gene_type:complete